MYATTRSDKLGRTYDECNEQVALGLHSGDNDVVLRRPSDCKEMENVGDLVQRKELCVCVKQKGVCEREIRDREQEAVLNKNNEIHPTVTKLHKVWFKYQLI